jgi:galactokinase
VPNPDLQQRIQTAIAWFQQLYGPGPIRILRAPARLNILGEHVDYVSYLPTASLPFGSHEHAMLLLWRPRTDDQVCGASLNPAFAPFAFALNEGPTSKLKWEAWLEQQGAPAPHWSNYVRGACFFAQWLQGVPLANGFDFLVDSTIPPRGGSSSSSALTVLAGAAVRSANLIEYSPAQLAQASSQAEWYCGTRGGALDHTAICLAERGQALWLSYADGAVQAVPLLNETYCWVTCFTHEADKGSHVLLEYNERAAVARILLPALLADLQQHRDDFAQSWQTGLRQLQAGDTTAFETLVGCLNELPPLITLAEFARHYPQAAAECARLFPMLMRERREAPLKLADRARHHLGEIARVRKAMNLLQAVNETGLDQTAQALGALLTATHISLRDLYEVSTLEVESLRAVLLADAQVYGARLMGGGFGGTVLALTTAKNVASLLARVQRDWYAPRGRDGIAEGAMLVSTPGAGLRELQG